MEHFVDLQLCLFKYAELTEVLKQNVKRFDFLVLLII